MDNVFARLAPVYALSSRGRDVTLSHWKFREMYIRHLKMQDSWSEAEKVSGVFLGIKMANLKTIFLDRSGPPIGFDATVPPSDD